MANRPLQDYSVDLRGDGIPDAVDLDPSFSNGIEFLSPQADYGLPGLGLTHGGQGLCAPLLWATLDGSVPLPAAGAASLSATREGSSVRLSITTGLEEADLLGFLAYRLEGSRRVLLNEKLLIARGGPGNRYEILDERDDRRGRGFAVYEVEVITRDGQVDQVLGPVRPQGGAQVPSRRR